jgi:hypothetical protein
MHEISENFAHNAKSKISHEPKRLLTIVLPYTCMHEISENFAHMAIAKFRTNRNACARYRFAMHTRISDAWRIGEAYLKNNIAM